MGASISIAYHNRISLKFHDQEQNDPSLTPRDFCLFLMRCWLKRKVSLRKKIMVKFHQISIYVSHLSRKMSNCNSLKSIIIYARTFCNLNGIMKTWRNPSNIEVCIISIVYKPYWRNHSNIEVFISSIVYKP